MAVEKEKEGPQSKAMSKLLSEATPEELAQQLYTLKSTIIADRLAKVKSLRAELEAVNQSRRQILEELTQVEISPAECPEDHSTKVTCDTCTFYRF